MVAVGTLPRQPRAGCSPNLAQVAAHTGPDYFGVELQQCGGTFFEVAQFAAAAPADLMRDNLNAVFAHPVADLDFTHMARPLGGAYEVVWAGVKWCRDGSCSTGVGCPTPAATTYEKLYKAGGLLPIASVGADDVAWYGLPAFKVAFLWTNNIRFAVNGWNCTKDVLSPPLFGGTIPVLPEPADWAFRPVKRKATVYGYGECQPNFQTANGEIFHTMDLLVAVPGKELGQARWARNQWVKIRYAPTRRSARARLVDVCGCDHLDLSRGLATYLGFPGSGDVTVSPP